MTFSPLLSRVTVYIVTATTSITPPRLRPLNCSHNTLQNSYYSHIWPNVHFTPNTNHNNLKKYFSFSLTPCRFQSGLSHHVTYHWSSTGNTAVIFHLTVLWILYRGSKRHGLQTFSRPDRRCRLQRGFCQISRKDFHVSSDGTLLLYYELTTCCLTMATWGLHKS